ncbi:MAG: hypothetical protein GY745_19240 [Actinomycetia bacterium]|nr:hypothetical protein [Actinomycetes bacterium]MCP3912880.1 hypothetical protein [Actinomycetes bacterium]MCP4087157.1 hypothetical protein [Actinomycetes bacterium]
MSGAVDWELAERVATRVAHRGLSQQGLSDPTLEADFAEMTERAEGLVAAETGLHSDRGPARARVASRTDWIRANIASFQRLLKPLIEQLDDQMGSSRFAPAGRKVSGAEVGLVLGWMSTRVLGQYDLLIVEDEDPDDQDIVYYVGPNVLTIEKRFAFPPDEFRLWLALHEVTHRAQFTGVPWLRPHFLSLVEQVLATLDADADHFFDGLKQMVLERKAGGKPLEEGGLAHSLASAEQRAIIDQISGMMSLLEGHGDVTMTRAGADFVPSARRFARVLQARRQQSGGATRILQRLIGLEAKLKQYEQGEAFIAAVEVAGGRAFFDRVWESPEMLPDLGEIREPSRWIERVRSFEDAAAN